MKTSIYLLAAAGIFSLTSAVQAASMESIEARVGFGTSPDAQGFAGFFENGFVQGSTSHTDTISYDDGVVKVDLDITVEGYDENGSPSGLRTTAAAVGVDGPGDSSSESTRIDTGEYIKVTFNDITYSVIGAPASGMIVDPSSFETLLSSVRFAAFDNGSDTYTYAGVGSANTVGDDTSTLEFMPYQPIADGDMFTVTADTGSFRGLYMSMSANYETVIPEPATLSLLAFSTVGLISRRR